MPADNIALSRARVLFNKVFKGLTDDATPETVMDAAANVGRATINFLTDNGLLPKPYGLFDCIMQDLGATPNEPVRAHIATDAFRNGLKKELGLN